MIELPEFRPTSSCLNSGYCFKERWGRLAAHAPPTIVTFAHSQSECKPLESGLCSCYAGSLLLPDSLSRSRKDAAYWREIFEHALGNDDYQENHAGTAAVHVHRRGFCPMETRRRQSQDDLGRKSPSRCGLAGVSPPNHGTAGMAKSERFMELCH